MTKLRIAVAGAGSRGIIYAKILSEQHREEAEVVAVAEPRADYREKLAADWALPEQRVFADWREMADAGPLADAVMICTQDAMHREPAEAFAAQGCHLLLEKPLAPNEADCRAIVQAVRRAGVMMAVCHVLRYTRPTRKLRELIDAGRIGDPIGIQHLEPVGFWHMAHSFVRGNWRNESQSSPILLSKSCHDLDWMRYVMGQPFRRVSSFGSLRHFRPEERPEGAAERCLDCGEEAQCPYSARRLYLGRAAEGRWGWPLDVLTSEESVEAVERALREGPYGRCVYACDNDVMDHQVVSAEFEDGRSGVFTLSAFTPHHGRITRIFGTRGQIHVRPKHMSVFEFLGEESELFDFSQLSAATPGGGHGGGDGALVAAFVAALRDHDPSQILSGPEESLETHLAVFAAERARRGGSVEPVRTALED